MFSLTAYFLKGLPIPTFRSYQELASQCLLTLIGYLIYALLKALYNSFKLSLKLFLALLFIHKLSLNFS